ncbi:MAG: hypothetical protein KBC64_05050 [Simkaniaceae bacterium]|nr:hypothetical protein [Simkaniaceae bacterium]
MASLLNLVLLPDLVNHVRQFLSPEEKAAFGTLNKHSLFAARSSLFNMPSTQRKIRDVVRWAILADNYPLAAPLELRISAKVTLILSMSGEPIFPDDPSILETAKEIVRIFNEEIWSVPVPEIAMP